MNEDREKFILTWAHTGEDVYSPSIITESLDMVHYEHLRIQLLGKRFVITQVYVHCNISNRVVKFMEFYEGELVSAI